MRSTRRLRLVTLLVVCLLASCSRAPEHVDRVPDSVGDGWEVGCLTDVGIEPAPIAQMVDAIRVGRFDSVTSILIVRDGRLVFEAYFHQGSNRYRRHYVASVTKSVTSILTGIAIDEGLIAGADQRVANLLPQYADLMADDPVKMDLRLWHLLSMTSGFDWDEETVPYGTAGNDCYEMEESPDAPAYVLRRSITDAPGTRFEYCAGNPALLSAIVETATGMRLDAYADQVLFGPLGIEDYSWRTYRDGHTDTSGGLSLRSRDMAKLGELMLAGGTWNGQRILSEAWVRQSAGVHARVSGAIQYGYQWWRQRQPLGLHSEEAFFAAGFGGQMIFVLPGLDAVVVITNDMSDENAGAAGVQVLMREYILPAMVGTTASDVFIWVWYVLTAAALLATIVLWTRDGAPGAGGLVAWVPVVCLLGPVGLVIRHTWLRLGKQRALGAAVYAATGCAISLLPLALAHLILVSPASGVFLPPAAIVLALLPVGFLVGWLLFRAPSVSLRFGIRYGLALKQTLFAEILSATVVAAGMVLPVALLMLRWFPRDVDLASPLYWLTVSAGSAAGTVPAWPLNVWMLSRGYDVWPWPAEQALVAAANGPSLPSLRRDWWMLIVALAAFAVAMLLIFS